MLSDTLALIFFVGGLQGLMLTFALGRLNRQHPALRYLTLLIGLVSVDLIGQLVYWQELYRQWPHLLGVNSFLPASYGPLFYLYVRKLLRPGSQLRGQDGLLFVPFVVCYALNIDVFLMSGPQKIAFVEHVASTGMPLSLAISNLIMLSSAGFVVAALVRLWRDRHIGIRSSWLDWVLIMGLFQILIWIVVVINLLLPLNLLFNGAPYLLVSLMLYVLGYKALFSSRPKADPLAGEPPAQTPAVSQIDDRTPAPVAPEPEKTDDVKYGNQRLDPETQAALWADLEKLLVGERLYTRPDLRVADLADLSGLPPYLVSQVINDSQGISFSELVNNLRLQEACRLLREDTRMPVQAVMEASGFQAKSTFNTLFKQFAGTTPSAYRKASSGR